MAQHHLYHQRCRAHCFGVYHHINSLLKLVMCSHMHMHVRPASDAASPLQRPARCSSASYSPGSTCEMNFWYRVQIPHSLSCSTKAQVQHLRDALRHEQLGAQLLNGLSHFLRPLAGWCVVQCRDLGGILCRASSARQGLRTLFRFTMR